MTDYTSDAPSTPSLTTDASTFSRPTTGESSRPATGRRPRTGVRRPRTTDTRPDTAASGISADELPKQEFFPEGEEFDEDEEYEEEEAEEVQDVFAFARPITAAPGAGGMTDSEYGTSAPNTGAPTTAGTNATGGTFGFFGGLRHQPAVIASAGNMDGGGHLPGLTYDVAHPPPFAGKNNLNNSSFAFSVSSNGISRPPTHGTSAGGRRPNTGRSLLERFYRRNITTGSSNETGTSAVTGTTDASRTSLESGTMSEAGSFTGELRTGRPKQPRRMRSNAPLISESGASDLTSEISTNRGYSRGSYGMTELTGDATVPDGKVTWGDGLGGLVKEGSEGDGSGVDLDLVEEDSPYAEVRASVSNIDDPDMPALTFRAWVLGLLFCAIGAACNTFFNFRAPAPSISALIIEIVAYPCGRFLAWLLPIRTFYAPKWLGGGSWSFNPGPFNIKEHALICIMANIAIGPAYSLYVTVSSELWYNRPLGVGFEILLTLATQLTGFIVAGLCRRFVVWPASMIWPSNLVVTTALNTFHAEEPSYSGSMTRFRFLMIVMGGAFAYYWLPGFLFTALSYFSWACWIAPRNNIVNQLFGVNTGLGMGILTFDWTQITWIGSPLYTPWWAGVNYAIGFVVCFWIIVPIIYYCNVWQTAYLPINVSQLGDRFGGEYDIFNILNPDATLNITAYAEYSPVYLSASFTMTFMVSFALATALLVHTILHHGPRIWRAILRTRSEAEDIHMRLMRRYPEAPDWWFAVLFGVVFILAVVDIEVYHTGLPVWAYIISVIIPLVYVVPASFIYAMTGQQVSINILAELIPGYILPGKPLPGMICKTFSVQTLAQALSFLQDQKLGHYIKVPPRSTFIAQLTAATFASFVQVGTKQLLFATVKDMCSSTQPHLLTCAKTKVFFTSSVVWGLIGPARLFSKGGMYYPQTFCALIGAVLPIPFWWWVRKYPRSIFRNLNFPVIFAATLWIPPATGINYTSWLVTNFLFQFWIRRKYFAWWSKYNYVMSAALDVGTAISAIVIFLVIALPGVTLNWWGNTVYQRTVDWVGDGAQYLVAPPTGFGPDTWKV